MGELIMDHENNIILILDSYKACHWKMYPPGTETVYSYFEAREKNDNKFLNTVFFGLQYYIKKYLTGWRVSLSDIMQAESYWTPHFGTDKLFNKEGWEYIHKKHGGRLPVSIKAVPEG